MFILIIEDVVIYFIYYFKVGRLETAINMFHWRLDIKTSLGNLIYISECMACDAELNLHLRMKRRSTIILLEDQTVDGSYV